MRRLLRGLEDADLLWTSVKDVPRGLLLHGHLHERIGRTLDTAAGQMLSVGATSASLEHEDEARMAGFNLYEISDAGAVGRIEAHVLDPKRGAFDVVSVPRWMD